MIEKGYKVTATQKCLDQVFKSLWQHYYQRIPFAEKIEKSLEKRGDLWIEDHVAFRCLPGPNTGSHVLAALFEAIGYEKRDDYHFADKKLNAFWLAPPNTSGLSKEASPKIFVSELIPDDFSEEFKKTLSSYTETVVSSPVEKAKQLEAQMKSTNAEEQKAAIDELASLIASYLTGLPPWQRPSRSDYEVLEKESEYASWTLLHGNQINHFTVSVHHMGSFDTIEQLGQYLENDLAIKMNHAGGLVKGTATVKLEQISTMAVKVPYLFQEGIYPVSYGFVEFAKRYELDESQNKELWNDYYQGFVVANANKIFESTYRS